jgi:ATP-dependent Clp protease protease subunit
MQTRKPALVRRGAIVSRPRAEARQRPGALPVPAQSATRAITPPAAFDRWSDEAAGVRALALGDNVITMMEIIGEDFWTGGGVTAKKVAAQLRAIGDRPVEVQINSPGGDMFEGLAIYNVLREHPQAITVKVMGMAASAASIIAMAGDTIEIGAASFLMIHNCWVVAVGNRHDLAETAAFLEPFDTAMAGVYAQRTGLDAKAIQKLMDAETYMSGQTAIDQGFADSLLPADAFKVDDKAKAADREFSKLRALELSLMAQGKTRSQARAEIHELRGTTDSAPPAATTDSDRNPTPLVGLAQLLANIKGK